MASKSLSHFEKCLSFCSTCTKSDAIWLGCVLGDHPWVQKILTRNTVALLKPSIFIKFICAKVCHILHIGCKRAVMRVIPEGIGSKNLSRVPMDMYLISTKFHPDWIQDYGIMNFLRRPSLTKEIAVIVVLSSEDVASWSTKWINREKG